MHKLEDAGPKLLSHFWELPAGQALGDFPLADGRGKPIALSVTRRHKLRAESMG